MALLTFSDILSRTRGKLKAFKQDIKITDRELWSYYKPWLSQVMKELDAKNKLMAFSSLFDSLDVVPLVEVDKIEAGCTRLKSGFTVMRTEDPIGEYFMEGYWGPMIRSVTSIDSSEDMQPITPEGYLQLSHTTDFKYNKTKYFWYLNDYIYFPNISWNAVRVVALVDGDISKYKCNSAEKCLSKQEQSLNVPDYVLSRVESLMFQSLGITLQLPADQQTDNKSPLNN